MKTTSITFSKNTFCKILLVTVAILSCSNLLEAQTSRTLFRRVMPSVVIVHVEKKASIQLASTTQPSEPTLGSGALISADGKVLTAAAVVRNAEQINVEFVNGSRIPARVLTMSIATDVAILELDRVPANAIFAPLGDSAPVGVGDEVFVIGSPAGIAHSLSVGWISARLNTDKGASAPELLQLDAALKVGNSGGPVFNLKGEIIGMVSHALTKSHNATKAGLAVTSNVVRKLMMDDKQ